LIRRSGTRRSAPTIGSSGKATGGSEGCKRGSPDRLPQAGTRLYWRVEDLEGVLDRARALGAVVERERTELGGDDRWFATLLDPAGVSLGFWTDREASS
jgi:predicted enzyme related to lactoylglutathione lyase